MRYPFLLILLAMGLLSLTACGGAMTATPASTTEPARPNQMPPANPNITPPVLKATLTGNAWILVSYGSVDAPTLAVPNSEARLSLTQDGQVSGNTGCNSLGGTYTLDGEKITFSELAMTMMACDGPVGEQELEVLNGLNHAERYVIEDNLLKIFYEGGARVLIYAADLPKL